MTLKPQNYIPCLRWKLGEYQAVSKLTSFARNSIMPISNYSPTPQPPPSRAGECLFLPFCGGWPPQNGVKSAPLYLPGRGDGGEGE
jgi:hypothetical protein